jgi:ribulose-5-phosphate 4-epimerase/fuculose-1-phosphate aldolase
MAKDGSDDLKERVAAACRVMGRLHLTREPAGHISARVPGTDHILIKARGESESGVRYTTSDDIITVDADGKALDASAGFVAPREVFIHTWMYKTRPDVNSVIHMHPSTVVAFTIVDRPLLPVYGAYDPASLSLWIKGIPNYDRSVLISNDKLGEELAGAIGDSDVIMMRGHGITTCGDTVEAAGMNAILINELAEMNYKALLIGTPRAIPDEDLAEFKERLGGRRAGAGAAWDTYRKMVDA